MKRSKNNHLGEGLNEIIKKQEKTNVDIPGEVISDSSLHDIVTGEKLESWPAASNNLTLVEELEEEIKKLNNKLREKEKRAFGKKEEVSSEKTFQSFKFIEKQGSYEIIIDKKKGNKKESLEKAFIEIIQEISDVNQFL